MAFQTTVTVNTDGNGSVVGGGTGNIGRSVTLTATPSPGWEFVEFQQVGSTNVVSSIAVGGFAASNNICIPSNISLTLYTNGYLYTDEKSGYFLDPTGNNRANDGQYGAGSKNYYTLSGGGTVLSGPTNCLSTCTNGDCTATSDCPDRTGFTKACASDGCCVYTAISTCTDGSCTSATNCPDRTGFTKACASDGCCVYTAISTCTDGSCTSATNCPDRTGYTKSCNNGCCEYTSVSICTDGSCTSVSNCPDREGYIKTCAPYGCCVYTPIDYCTDGSCTSAANCPDREGYIKTCAAYGCCVYIPVDYCSDGACVSDSDCPPRAGYTKRCAQYSPHGCCVYSATACTSGFQPGTFVCGTGNKIYGSYVNSDCSTTLQMYTDCDTDICTDSDPLGNAYCKTASVTTIYCAGFDGVCNPYTATMCPPGTTQCSGPGGGTGGTGGNNTIGSGDTFFSGGSTATGGGGSITITDSGGNNTIGSGDTFFNGGNQTIAEQ